MTYYQKARKRIDELLCQGMSLDKIAVEAGVDLSTVQRRRKALKLASPSAGGAAQLPLFAA